MKRVIINSGMAFVQDDKWVTINGRHVLIKEKYSSEEASPPASSKSAKPYKKVGKVYKFTNMDDYERWIDELKEKQDELMEKGSDPNPPACIDDGWKVSMDGYFKGRTAKEALGKFERTFNQATKGIGLKEWVEMMTSSCEDYNEFSDSLTYKNYPHDTEEEIRRAKDELRRTGSYSWGVEPIDGSKEWYIYLNVSGVHAGREERE